MARLKQLMGDSFVQIALILSLLRTDLSHYLQQYSNYPEVQQALLGQSLGLQVVDIHHDNEFATLPSKFIDDREIIWEELNRLAQSPRILTPDVYQRHIVSAWLVTDDQIASSSTSVATPVTMPTDPTAEDIQLIESLWKQDMDSSTQKSLSTPHLNPSPVRHRALSTGQELASVSQLPQAMHMETNTPEYERWISSSDEQSLLSRPTASFMYNDTDPVSMQNITMDMHPYLYNVSLADLQSHTDGHLTSPFRRYSSLSHESLLNADVPDLVSEFLGNADDLDLELDFDPNEVFASLTPRDSISNDSAVSMGCTTPSDWSDCHSNVSYSPDDMAYGAVGYSPPRLDNGFFEYPANNELTRLITHDHTYGAPPGGQPHVRKMDIKVTKDPRRGSAHDEMMCRKLKVPISIQTIIDSPVDEFNQLIERYPLSARQVTLIRDIRRRGKNKVAAQNCRKKKTNEIVDLEETVNALVSRRDSLLEEKSQLSQSSELLQKHISVLSREAFAQLRDSNGQLYDPEHYMLVANDQGEIEVKPIHPSTRVKRSSKTSKKRKR